ncbi:MULTISPECIES: helix-turn-helix domain-containing protein [unclassified Haloferax]|uniref:helix-turn-helix domain-containing protein n=1 Tax=unclassified Haloferax TaxID=2625095 RepID=UPI0002B0781D|nr:MULTISPECIES: helix-turn-helix domain-containing protein [unclassified Haloferax]ELZ61336.1 Bacterio-opsin activator HTH domain protein [Haloferax sp. ATCC BAA-645]ELZ62105.1 Bacterio-opsin activator HTH domain protein [Haloferax sp. ATCC BAA-646]ELZ71345.1 Bacterio-opsin activator HTH domain protein [Haloferax sp. ATCC BAA-644]
MQGLSLQPGLQLFIIQTRAEEGISEDDLLALDEVIEATLLGQSSSKAIFKLSVELDETLATAFDRNTNGAVMDSIRVTGEGWHKEELFKDYAEFTAFRTTCEENDIDVEILSLTQTSAHSDDNPPYGLTKRQHEALTLAFSGGYYERPRQVTAEQLAEDLDISQPAMSNLLRRGERQLLSETIDAQRHIN